MDMMKFDIVRLVCTWSWWW